VLHFQTAQGLTATGCTGPLTRARINTIEAQSREWVTTLSIANGRTQRSRRSRQATVFSLHQQDDLLGVASPRSVRCVDRALTHPWRGVCPGQGSIHTLYRWPPAAPGRSHDWQQPVLVIWIGRVSGAQFGALPLLPFLPRKQIAGIGKRRHPSAIDEPTWSA
jgi:hypothetical protein